MIPNQKTIQTTIITDAIIELFMSQACIDNSYFNIKKPNIKIRLTEPLGLILTPIGILFLVEGIEKIFALKPINLNLVQTKTTTKELIDLIQTLVLAQVKVDYLDYLHYNLSRIKKDMLSISIQPEERLSLNNYIRKHKAYMI